MPIRFRCAYCNQLLGISRRKAGTVVRCPTCAGQVVVPSTDVDAGQGPPGQSNPLVFERNDFEDLLTDEEGVVPLDNKGAVATAAQQASPSLAPDPKPPPGAWGTHAEPAYDVERINPAPTVATAEPLQQTGIFLSPKKATILAIIVAVAFALFFTGGLMVGLYIRPAQELEAQ